ncbi:MAG: hypothetical protein DMG59_01035 [Acidobacteria bacterium]|jgi:hypothetical protein|nr:MAG: hypothetical protein DMG59_01035 [Acidobacteriota bacterium]
MEFVLTGFRQDTNIRRYRFEAIAADRTRKEVIVGADLGLIRKYKIPLQELPLLCRRLLEGHAEATALMFTETDMLGYANDRAAAAHAAEQKRRAHRAPTSSRVGQAWRTR